MKKEINEWLILSVVATMLIFPLGLISLVKMIHVRRMYGIDRTTAEKLLVRAKTWVLSTYILYCALFVLFFIIICIMYSTI